MATCSAVPTRNCTSIRPVRNTPHPLGVLAGCRIDDDGGNVVLRAEGRLYQAIGEEAGISIDTLHQDLRDVDFQEVTTELMNRDARHIINVLMKQELASCAR